MTRPFMESLVRPQRLIWFVPALCAGIMLVNLGGWDLWNPDEPRYAQVAREMMETGQYTVPHLNAEPYPDKPPLYFWLVTLCARFSGDVTAVAARLPSVLAAIGVLALTFFLGRRLLDPFAALLSVIILFTTEQFFTVAVSAHLDTLLTLLTTAAILLMHRGIECRPAGTIFFLGAYACMGLALLTKGPVGLCVPLISCAAYLLLRKEWRLLRQLHLGTGLLLAAGTLALWLVPACLLGGEAYRTNILFTQTFGRTIESYSHQNPFYYYLIEFPIDFFPWSVFIPSACLYYWRRRERLRDMQLPLAWFAATFLFFSCISCKRSLYLLPLYPAAALLMARFWADCIRDAATIAPRLVTVPFRILCSLLAGFGIVGAALVAADIAVIRPIHHEARIFYILSAMLVGAGLFGLWRARRFPQSGYCFGHVAAATAGIFLLVVTLIFPAMNSVKSGRFLCERIRQHVGSGDRLLATFEPELFNYFLHRYPIPVVGEEDAQSILLQSPEKAFVLIRSKNLDKKTASLPAGVVVLERQRIGHREYALVAKSDTNFPHARSTIDP